MMVRSMSTTPTTTPRATMSLRPAGGGLFYVTSTKTKRNGEVEEATYPVFAHSLRCKCPAALQNKLSVCKHAHFVDDYLAGKCSDFKR